MVNGHECCCHREFGLFDLVLSLLAGAVGLAVSLGALAIAALPLVFQVVVWLLSATWRFLGWLYQIGCSLVGYHPKPWYVPRPPLERAATTSTGKGIYLVRGAGAARN